MVLEVKPAQVNSFRPLEIWTTYPRSLLLERGLRYNLTWSKIWHPQKSAIVSSKSTWTPFDEVQCGMKVYTDIQRRCGRPSSALVIMPGEELPLVNCTRQANVTAVLTSCRRHDLLEETLRTFFEMNTAPLDQLIVVEDGPDIPKCFRDMFSGQPIDWISTGRRVGQIAAIDYAYSRIRTPYVFHIEDDWHFYRSGFIESSMPVLNSNPKCIQVYIRALDDLMGHPIQPGVYQTPCGIEWRQMAYDYFGEGDWHGFSLNPGLRRMSDYLAIAGYGVHTKFDKAIPWLAESALGKLYRQRDFFAAVLSGNEGSGYVRHTGDGRHVGPDSDVKS
jgi:hypothetical protein